MNPTKPEEVVREQVALPELDITPGDHMQYDEEWETRWDGYPVDAICAQLYCRERQLLAALTRLDEWERTLTMAGCVKSEQAPGWVNRRAEKAEAELRAVDATLARRPAIAYAQSRHEAIEMAFNEASKVAPLRAENVILNTRVSTLIAEANYLRELNRTGEVPPSTQADVDALMREDVIEARQAKEPPTPERS